MSTAASPRGPDDLLRLWAVVDAQRAQLVALGQERCAVLRALIQGAHDRGAPQDEVNALLGQYQAELRCVRAIALSTQDPVLWRR